MPLQSRRIPNLEDMQTFHRHELHKKKAMSGCGCQPDEHADLLGVIQNLPSQVQPFGQWKPCPLGDL